MLTNPSLPAQEYTTIHLLIDQIIIKKIDDYLKNGRTGKKAENAELAKKNINDLRNSTESLEIILNKISEILTDWENNNSDLKGKYWVPEVTSKTPALIADCRAEIKAWREMYTKERNNNNPSPVLHAFPNQINLSIEDQLFLKLEKHDYAGFEQLILQNPKGYNVNAKDQKGKTLLHHASKTPDTAFLSLLLKEGANPNIGDEHGWTPVNYAAFAGHATHITLFMDNNPIAVEWDLVTNAGSTLYDTAIQGQNHNQNPLTQSKMPNAKHDEVIQILNERLLNPSSSKLTKTTLLSPSS